MLTSCCACVWEWLPASASPSSPCYARPSLALRPEKHWCVIAATLGVLTSPFPHVSCVSRARDPLSAAGGQVNHCTPGPVSKGIFLKQWETPGETARRHCDRRELVSWPKALLPCPPDAACVCVSLRGIGFALAKKLVSVGFEVVLACRNEQRGKAASAAITAAAAPGHPPLHLMLVDVSSVASVTTFCAQFQARCVCLLSPFSEWLCPMLCGAPFPP